MTKPSAQFPVFRDSDFLEWALTHSSYINEHPEGQKDNERLEFLGDAILNFLSGEFLYQKYPQKPEGELTQLRSLMVDAKQLAEFANQLNLGEHLRLGRGAERDGGRSNPRILSSGFEAIIGAYFLDCGSNIEPVRKYVMPFFETIAPQLDPSQNSGMKTHASNINYKSRFQEWALAKFGENPTYIVQKESGHDHAKTFEIEAQVKGKQYGQGTGRKKQDAEKDAARDALDRLGLL